MSDLQALLFVRLGMEEQNRKVGVTVVAQNDTKGAFQEIRSDARDLAEIVEQFGQRSARGINVIGDSAEGVAQKLTREEGRMTAAMLRATEQALIAAKAGDSLSKAFEIKAELSGLDISRLSPMVVQLREAEQALAAFKSQQSQQASQSAFLDNLRSQAEALGKTRLELLELTAAQLGLKNEAAPYIAQLRDADSAMGKTGKSASELQLAMRGVPAVLGDIAVSIQGGVPALTIFMQQGLQLRDMFGGFGAAARGVGAAVLGMLDPFTVAVVAADGLFQAYSAGAKEQSEFVKSLTLTGNVSGVTADQLREYAREIDSVVGTEAKAAEGLVEFVNAGVKGGEALRRYTETAIEWERATGEGVDKTAAKFASLQEDPLAAVQKLNEGSNFLTVAVYEQIKALQDQGDETAASEVAMDALDTAMRDRSKRVAESLGWIEKAWRGIKDEAADAVDAMLRMGRPSTKQEELNRVRSQIATKEESLKKYSGTPYAETASGQKARANDEAELEKFRNEEWRIVNAINGEVIDGLQQDANRLALAAQVSFHKSYAGLAPRTEKRDKALMEQQKRFADSVATNNLSGAALEKARAQNEAAMASIRKQYADPKGSNGASRPARDGLSIDVTEFKRQLDGMTNIYAGSQKILEAQRSAGLIDDRDYFEARRGFINLEADAQDMLLSKELERLKLQEKTEENRLQSEGIQAKLDKSRVDRDVSLELLSMEETAAVNAQKAAIGAVDRSAAADLWTLQRGIDRSVDAVGWGTERRNVEGGRQQIEDRYSQQRLDLNNQRADAELKVGGKLNADQVKYYEGRQAIIDKYQALALDSYNNGVQRRLEAEGDWLIGASRALEDYSSSTANVAQMSASAFTNAFKGMEDALVSFAMTGKADFKSLANSMIAEIVRMQARAAISGLFGGVSSGGGLLGSIVSGVSSLFGGGAVAAESAGIYSLTTASGYDGGGLGLRRHAKGGVYDSPSLSTYRNQVHATPQLFAFANGLGVFGEAGPEAIMPLTRAPDGNLGVRALAPLPSSVGASNVQVEVFVDASSGNDQMQAAATSRSNDATSQQLGKMLGGMFKDLLMREMRPGGVLWAFNNGRA